MTGMGIESAFRDSDHPRGRGGRFTDKPRVPQAGAALADGPFAGGELDAASAAAGWAVVWMSPEVEQWRDEHPDADEPELGGDEKTWLRDELADFTAAYRDLVDQARHAGLTGTDGGRFAAAFGHDYALTRGRVGAGFWDRPALQPGDLGTRLAGAVIHRPWPDMYVDDDGVARFDSPGYFRAQQRVATERMELLAGQNRTPDGQVRWAKIAYVMSQEGLLDHLSYRQRRRMEDEYAQSMAPYRRAAR